MACLNNFVDGRGVKLFRLRIKSVAFDLTDGN